MNDIAEDVAQAHRVATDVLEEYGTPAIYPEAHNLIAYAYAMGRRDGYKEAAATAERVFTELKAVL